MPEVIQTTLVDYVMIGIMVALAIAIGFMAILCAVVVLDYTAHVMGVLEASEGIDWGNITVILN
jgi:hypothetical protein